MFVHGNFWNISTGQWWYLQTVSAPLYYLETVDDGNQTEEE